MNIKNLLPYLTLFTNVLDDIFIGFVLLNIRPFVVMPVWYLSAAVMGMFFYFFTQDRLKNLHSLLVHWRYTLSYLFFSMMSGVFWFFSIYYLGISGNAVIDQTQYIVLILWGVFAFKENVTKVEWFGAILIFSGLLIFSFGTENQGHWLGILFACLTTLGMAGSIITKKYAAGKVNHNAVITLRAIVMCLIAITLGISIGGLEVSNYYGISYVVWLAMVIGGAVGAGISHQLSMAALHYNNLSTYTFAQMLQPLIIVLFGVLVYQDSLSDLQLLAVSFVLVGKVFALVTKQNKFI